MTEKAQRIDLRSDTVTQPTPAMRAAMAAAEVGDDVYLEDPTVLRLESRAAEVFEREAALFVPTGTMGNQIAIRLHTQPGQEVICESRAHIVEWEMATMSVFSGCLPRTAYAERGILRWEHIEPLIAPDLYYHAPTGLIALENTHNLAGGTVTPLEVLEEVWGNAKEAGLPIHLDGARIFNAAVALQRSVAELTSGFDTVMFCLSKGLCAPVGSMLVGSCEAMNRARSIRKALGGGMRQVGVLAAAGLIALEQMPGRLHEDHENARMLADRLAVSDRVQLDLSSVQTNIVIFSLDGIGAADVVRHARESGVSVSAFGPKSIRLVTHHDVDRFACQRAGEILLEAISLASRGLASSAKA
jgi:threonine aldolase